MVFYIHPKLAQRTYEEGHRVVCDEARILEIDGNSWNKKFKESVHMACLKNPMRQLILDVSPILSPIINEVTKHKGLP
jgi:hypothetical protein